MYSGDRKSINEYRKMERINIRWKKGNEDVLSVHRFNWLVDDIRSSRELNTSKHNLPPLNSNWLDQEIGLALQAPILSVEGKKTLPFALKTNFGDDFPITPSLDREGAVFSSFQLQIQNNILRLHKKIVEESDEVVKMSGSWLSDLRMIANESVSLLDITLHQLYIRAEYNALPGWRFPREKLGDRTAGRLLDKLKWITHICGNPLDNAEEEIFQFKKLKDLRNHLHHFDPPCFAYTIEDLAEWLNIVPSVGRLLWKIRKRLKVQLSDSLIKIIMLPEVEINPLQAELPRPAQTPETGYASSVWETE